jgi:hypothetical protein
MSWCLIAWITLPGFCLTPEDRNGEVADEMSLSFGRKHLQAIVLYVIYKKGEARDSSQKSVRVDLQTP